MSSWLRVAGGLQKVASAAAAQAAQESQVLATRVMRHGVDMASKAQASVAAATSAQDWMSQPRESDSTSRPMEAPTTSDTQSETRAVDIDKTRSCHDVNGASNDQSERIRDTDNEIDALSSHDNTILSKPLDEDERYDRLKEGKRVPATRVGRAFGFASLGAGLAFGTAAELTSRLFGGSDAQGSVAASDANAYRLAATLCRMRGAALKLGQMLSIQDETLLPPALSRALEQVRQGADAMPKYQLEKQLESQLGPNWRDLFIDFDELPFAAASIGQVHRAKIHDGSDVKDVVMKVQYPGVANSIESDLRNLQMLINLTGLAPPGLFIEEVMRVGRNELKVECDYVREMENQLKFKKLVEEDPQLSRERFVVPGVYKDLTTEQVITSDYVRGGTIDKVSHLDQEERNRIAYNIMYLTMQELFVWRFMQTDPNWGNFLYDMGNRTTYLIDFGAAREFSKSFVDGYLRIVCANANRDEETLMAQSLKMNFLTGEENDIMLEAHKMSGFTVGEPFWSDEPFDFRGSSISSRLSQHSSAFMKHRLT
jgi:aarF domain-containing kinase